MSVTAVSGGHNGELLRLLKSLNDLSVKMWTHAISQVHFKIIKIEDVTNKQLGEIEIILKDGESLYEKLIYYVPLREWKELQNATTLGLLRSLRVTRDSNAVEVKTRIDTWANTLFYYTLTQVVNLHLKVQSRTDLLNDHPRHSLPQPIRSRVSNSLAQLENNGGIKEHLALVDHSKAPWNSIPIEPRVTSSSDFQSCECDRVNKSMKVKKSWWDETDMDSTERMRCICHEISMFSRKTRLRIFMINNINITTDDVKLLLNELKNDKLKILSLNNVNLDDEGAECVRKALEVNSNGNWKELTQIFLSRNSRISPAVRQSISLSWQRAYGSRNANLEEHKFFLYFDGS